MPENIATATVIAEKQTAVDYAELKMKYDALKAEHDALKAAHKKALDFIDEINRAKLAPFILENTKLTKTDIANMSTDALQELAETIKLVKKPAVSVDSELSVPANSRLTAGDKFKWANVKRGGNA